MIQAEQALGGPADHGEIFLFVLLRLIHRLLGLLLFDGNFGTTAALGFPPTA